MYNKYILNRLLLWYSEEPACVGLFLLFLLCRYEAMTSLLRGVLILLSAAAAEIHPAQVISVCYPVVGAQSAASAVHRGVSAHGTWEEKWGEWGVVGWGVGVMERVGGGEQEGLVFFRERRAWAKLRTSLDCGPTFDQFLHRDSWRKLVSNGLILEVRCKCALIKHLKNIKRHSTFYLVKRAGFWVTLDKKWCSHTEQSVVFFH